MSPVVFRQDWAEWDRQIEGDAAAGKLDGLMKQALAGWDTRALGTDAEDGVLWAWIGTHAEYNRLI